MLSLCTIATSVNASVAPLSTITISSKKMTGAPTHNTARDYAVSYTEDVKVVLADQSVITADKLEVIMHHGIMQKNNKKNAETTAPYKEIKLSGNVHIKRREHAVSADAAEFIVAKQACKVAGNVKIVQAAKQSAEMPLVIHSNQALLDLTSEKLILLGSQAQPVTTTLVIGDAVGFKKKSSTRKA